MNNKILITIIIGICIVISAGIMAYGMMNAHDKIIINSTNGTNNHTNITNNTTINNDIDHTNSKNTNNTQSNQKDNNNQANNKQQSQSKTKNKEVIATVVYNKGGEPVQQADGRWEMTDEGRANGYTVSYWYG